MFQIQKNSKQDLSWPKFENDIRPDWDKSFVYYILYTYYPIQLLLLHD